MPSTVSSNTRATRSRLSSPQRKPNGAAEAAPPSNGTEGSKKTFMQRWLEPPLQNKASFQEIGLQRHGVVENMAPLGTLPKAAMSKKLIAAAVRESSVGQDTSTPVSKKIILKRPNTTNNTPAAAVVAVPTEQEPEALTVPAKRRNHSSKAVEEDDDDGDYKPKSSGAAHQSAATPSSPSAGRIKVTRRSLAKPSPSRSAPDSLHQTTAADESLSRSGNQENVDKVVEAAVDEALRHFRYPTAWALRTLYDENSSNPHFVSMFEQVFQQTATSETLKKFQRLLHDKKKEGKKDNKGCYYFVPPSTNSRFTPHKPRPAPYGDLIRLELPKMSASEPDVHVSKKLKTGKTRSTPASGRKAGGSHGVNGSSRAHLESPLRNRGQRALSVGSDSSLSSVQSVSPPDEFDDDEMEDDEDRGGAVAGRPSASGGSPSRAPAATQPIASRVRSVAAKKNGDVSPTPNPNSPSSIPDSAAPGMPALVDDPISFPSLQSVTSSRKTRRSEKTSPSPTPAALKFPSRFGPPDETDLRSQYRNSSRNCSESLKNAPESFVRGGRQSRGRDSSVPAKRKAARELDEAEVATPKQQQEVQQSRGPTTRSTRSSRKRARDDVDDEASPTSVSFPPPPEPSSSRMNSRAGTPSNARTSKKPRTGPRVKNSPMKKKAGPSAGVPRASGERGSPVPNGPSSNQDENDDYCSSCGGNGELVCCDGCTRAFHFKCVDPPLLQGALPDEWYCNVCLVTRNPAALTQHAGCFSTLLNIIEKKNSSAFRLPGDVRGYFEGVKTGTDGEYETVAPPASKTKKRGVYDDPPDFFRIRTPEGRATLCHNCSTSATDNRPIIPCSLCGLWWHIDCLDPPLANPPVLRTWVCPAHVDDLLAQLPDSLAPAHKFRKIKGASVIKPAFRRGTVNNGFVEIDDDSETDAASGWKDVGSFGHLYRLPATGVKLDFISRVREKRRFRKSTKPVEPVPPRHAAVPTQPAQQDSYLRDTRLIDQALATDNLRAATGHVDLLVEAMLAEADPSILAVMARGNALSIKSDDEIATADLQSLQAARAQMEAMMARIDQRLRAANAQSAQAAVEQQEQQEQQQSGTAKKDVSTPTVTTPEPDEPVPSAKDQEARADDIVVKTDGNSPANADIEDVAMATPAATTATEEKQDIADIDMASNPGDIPGDGETPKAKKTSTKDAEKLDAMLTPSTSPMATQNDADTNNDGGKTAETAKPDAVEKSEAGADWDMHLG